MNMLLHWRKTITSVLETHVVLCCLIFAVPNARAAEPESLWSALREGMAFAMMRHESAPGTGDPVGFDVDDCSTQRNLSDIGRQQAIETGKRFRNNGIRQALVFASAWCRCRDTAVLLDIGPVETLQSLNSFYGQPTRREPQTTALSSWLVKHKLDAPLVLVTHQVNIRALTGTYTKSGEIVVVRREKDGTFTVSGKL